MPDNADVEVKGGFLNGWHESKKKEHLEKKPIVDMSKLFKEKKGVLGHKLIIHPDAFKESTFIKGGLFNLKRSKRLRNASIASTFAGGGYVVVNLATATGIGAVLATPAVVGLVVISGLNAADVMNERKSLANKISTLGWKRVLTPEAFEHFKAMGYHKKYPAKRVSADASRRPFDNSLKVRPRKKMV